MDGLRSKLNKAILNCKKKASVEKGCVEMSKQDNRAELVDAIERANGKVLDLPLLRSIFRRGCIMDLAPDLQIQCFLGCGQEMPAKDYLEHEKVCTRVREKCTAQFTIPYIGREPEVVSRVVGVRHDQ